MRLRDMLKAKPRTIKTSPRSLYDDNKQRIVESVTKFLAAQAKVIIPQVLKLYGEPFYGGATKLNLSRALFKSATPLTPEELVKQVKLNGWDTMVDVNITPEIEDAFNSAGMHAINQLANGTITPVALATMTTAVAAPEPTAEAVVQTMTSLVNELAVDYAKEQSALLVTQIIDSTRNMIQQTVARALTESKGSFDLATMLEESRAFSPERADLIAAYELGTAACAGNIAAWKASGVVKGKQWITAEDEIVSDTCTLNAEQGEIPLDEEFQSGHQHPLAHPMCRCSSVAIVGKVDKPKES